MSNVTCGDWANKFLAAAGFPTTADNVAAVLTWMVSEGSTAKNNPLDTTEPWPGSTEFNSAGVKNYDTYENGIAATVATIHNGYYNANIVPALNAGNNAANTVEAINWSAWGSKPTIDMLNSVVANLPEHLNAPSSAVVSDPTVADTTAPTPEPNVTDTTAPTGEPSTNDPLPAAGGGELAAPIVRCFGLVELAHQGYYMVSADGGVQCFGAAQYHGSIPELISQGKMGALAAPIVDGFCADNNGYCLVGADGGVFAFGAASQYDFGVAK